MPGGLTSLGGGDVLVHGLSADDELIPIRASALGSLRTASARQVLDDCESVAGVTGVNVANIALSTAHRGRGAHSLEFDKIAGGATCYIQRDIDAIDIGFTLSHSTVEWYIYLSDLTDVVSVYLALGSEIANMWAWVIPVADLQVGWNHLHHPMTSIDIEAGVGAVLSTVTWWGAAVTFGAAANTLADIRVDNLIHVVDEPVYLADIHGIGYDAKVDVVALPGRGILISDIAADDSDKSFAVPANYQYSILSIFVGLTTDATVGDRQIMVEAQDGAATVIGRMPAGITQAASLTRYYQFSPSAQDSLAFRDTDFLSVPLPMWTLPATYVLRVYDNNAVAAAADDMTVQIIVQREPI